MAGTGTQGEGGEKHSVSTQGQGADALLGAEGVVGVGMGVGVGQAIRPQICCL